MKYKRIAIFLAVCISLFFLSSCSSVIHDYQSDKKASALYNAQKRLDYFNKHKEDFIQLEKQMTENDIGYININYNSVEDKKKNYIKVKNYYVYPKLSEKKCSQAVNLVSKLNLDDVSNCLKTLSTVWFTYGSDTTYSVGWIYSHDGVEPDTKKNGLDEVNKINDDWYSYRE